MFLSLGAIILYLVGYGMAFAAAANCVSNASGSTAAVSTCAAGGVGISSILMIVGGLLTLVGWIMGLVKTAQIRRWGWFVLVLLLSPLGSLIYGIAGPEA